MDAFGTAAIYSVVSVLLIIYYEEYLVGLAGRK